MNIESSITGKTRILAVIGNPIEHSISPQLHNTISKYLGLDFAYVPFKVDKNRLTEAVNGMRALNVAGFNITIPFKEEVIGLLDKVSEDALLMGAVNTVKISDGFLCGYNTDAEAFAKSFKEETGSGFKGKTAIIAGAGGTARALACKIVMEGAKRIYLINRTESKAVNICNLINTNFGKSNLAESFSTESPDAINAFKAADIIVNTTSAGMSPNINERPLEGYPEFSSNQAVYDVIYNPGKTRFLEDASKCGCKIANGLGMLFYQGIYAYEIWMGIKLPEDMLKELYGLFTRSFSYNGI